MIHLNYNVQSFRLLNLFQDALFNYLKILTKYKKKIFWRNSSINNKKVAKGFMQPIHFWGDWQSSQTSFWLNFQNVLFSLLRNDLSTVVQSLFRYLELGLYIWFKRSSDFSRYFWTDKCYIFSSSNILHQNK